jgi:hypothetical protein
VPGLSGVSKKGPLVPARPQSFYKSTASYSFAFPCCKFLFFGISTAQFCNYLCPQRSEFMNGKPAAASLHDLAQQTKTYLQTIYEGGGKKAVAKQRERGKLTARERIAYLVDKDTTFVEIGAFAGWEMYEEQGGCPAGGTVAGVGYVRGRQCVVVANDQTVKAGAWFPITGKKNLRLQEIAMQNHLPIIY